MKWSGLKFDETGVAVSTTFKTGTTRYIRLVKVKEHLIKIKNEYPGDTSGEGFVFLDGFKKPFTYSSLAKQVGGLLIEVVSTGNSPPTSYGTPGSSTWPRWGSVNR